MALNKVLLIGNLGKDPEVRTTEQDVKVAQFPLATSESYKDRDGNKVENTEWHNIVAWRGLAEICEKYARKGSSLFVEGRLKTRSWEDRDGQRRYVTEVVAENIQLLGRRGDGGERPPLPSPPPEPERRQTVTEAAARVAALQRGGQQARPSTTPLLQPEEIADDLGADDLPF